MVIPPGIEPGLPACRAGVVPLDHEPVSSSLSVDRRGVEPRLSGCDPDVVPLDQQPIKLSKQRSVRESNPIVRATKAACYRNTYRPFNDPGWTRTIVSWV